MVLTPQEKRGNVLCGRGFGEGLSRGNQGWAILSLSLKGITGERRGKGGGIPFPADLERGKERDGGKHVLFANFSCREKGQIGTDPHLLCYKRSIADIEKIM